MQRRDSFDGDPWNRRDWNRRDWDNRDRDDRGGTRERAAAAGIGELLQRAGLWAAGCLALASLALAALVAPLLRELLLLSAVVESMTALLRGETLTLQQVNRQDVAMLLLALGLLAGLFVDHAALQALVESGGQGAAAAG